MGKIKANRIFICDDHQMVIDGINLMIEGHTEFIVVGDSTEPLLVLEKLNGLNVDILITDVGMPGMSGVELSRVVKNKYPSIKKLALSMFGDSQIIAEMIDAGIAGYILKNAGRKELMEALNKIA